MKHYTLTAEQMQQVREAVGNLVNCANNVNSYVLADYQVPNSAGLMMARAEQRVRSALALLDAAMQAPEATDRDSLLYEMVKDFDVYGTGGDVSSCIREMKQQIQELRDHYIATTRKPEATDREGWLTREEIANLFRPLPAGEKWATIPEAELQALCRMALFALSVPAEATAGGDVREAVERIANIAIPGHGTEAAIRDIAMAALNGEPLPTWAALAAAPKPCEHGCQLGDGAIARLVTTGEPCPIHGTKPEAPTEPECAQCGFPKWNLVHQPIGVPESLAHGHPFTPKDATPKDEE